MSIQALSWVITHSPTKGTDRLVLLSIANHASTGDDGEWEAYPGVALIQREANVDRLRTAQDALTRLVTAGAITRELNAAPDQRIPRDRRPNLYRILRSHGVSCGDTRCVWCGVSPDAGRGVAPSSSGVSLDDATGCRDAAPKPSLEPREEPSEEPNPFSAAEVGLWQGFDQFWSVWPDKRAKGTARKAWRAAVQSARSIHLIVGGAERYRDDPNRDPRFTKHAATWLRGECWNDPPLPARAGRPVSQQRAIMDDREGPEGRIDL